MGECRFQLLIDSVKMDMSINMRLNYFRGNMCLVPRDLIKISLNALRSNINIDLMLNMFGVITV